MGLVSWPEVAGRRRYRPVNPAVYCSSGREERESAREERERPDLGFPENRDPKSRTCYL